MTFIQKRSYYFDTPGPSNTADAARFSVERAKELGVKTIVVASSSGKTAQVFSDAMKGSGLQLVVVTHVVGFTKPGEWEFSKEIAETLRKEGVKILGYEMTMWVHSILDKHWTRISRQSQGKGNAIEQGIAETFTGLGITFEDVRDIELNLKIDLVHATSEDLIPFCAEIVKISKPMLVVGNKFDEAPEALRAKLAEQKVAFASAASELALRNAAAANVIRYLPGDEEFKVVNEATLSAPQKAGLAKIADVMKQCKGTGVQQAINRAVFELLDMIVVYPVEDENHYCNKQGDVLPDAFLMRKGSTPHDLAYQVHTEIGKGFLYAVDAKTKMRIKENHELKNGDVIKIVSAAK